MSPFATDDDDNRPDDGRMEVSDANPFACAFCGGDHKTDNCDMSGRMEAPAGYEQFQQGEREYARDMFAAAWLQGRIAYSGGGDIQIIAQTAYRMADAMMVERDKRRGT